MKIHTSQLLVILFTLLGMMSCKKNLNFELQAKLEGLTEEKILVVYDDPASKTDTIFPENGKFTYTFTPDTTTLFRLVSSKGEIIPIFADKSVRVQLKGSFAQPVIQGDGDNKAYGEFLTQIRPLQGDSTTQSKMAEEFIRTHLNSFASAYILNQYFVQVPHPDMKKVAGLIEPLHGSVKDSHIISSLLNSLPDNKNKSSVSDYLNYFSCKDRSNKYITWSSNKGRTYTLINFWASWDQASMTARDSLAHIPNDLKGENYRILNISLDYDKEAWLNACKEDSKQWIEVCDYKGWNNQVIKQNKINQLPANILVDHNRKIMGTNLYGKELHQKVLQLIEADKAKKNNK